MYTYAHKSDIKRKTGNVEKKNIVQQKKSVPMYVLRDMPSQSEDKDACSVVQRYPVEVKDGRLVATKGRPKVPDTTAFREGLRDRIYGGTYQSAFEMDIQETYPNREDAVGALSHKGKYRSQEKVAFCHKISISDIEKKLVNYANTGTIAAEFTGYLERIGLDLDELRGVERAATIEEKKVCVNRLIKKINELYANYYVGSASTNSTIRDHFDPHVDFMTGDMSPISSYIFDNQEAMGITPTMSDGYGGYFTSSFDM